MYDLIIIGAGPAGFTSAIFAARREMKTLIISKDLGGQLVWASEIENYPGFSSISSFDLIDQMNKQVINLGVQIKQEEVKEILNNIENFQITTNKNKYFAKTIICAIGLSPRRLAIDGEEKFTGKGVSYCANCDGPFYKNKKVAVVGGGNSALDAAEVLSKIASKVYLIHRRNEFRGFETLVDEVKQKTNIEIMLESEVKEISGSDKLEKIKISNINKEEKDIEIDGLFIEVGRIANTDIVKEFVDLDEKNQIIVDRNCMTKTSGIFAVGDVASGEFKQITIATGQATIAALSAYKYLQLKQGKNTNLILDRGKK